MVRRQKRFVCETVTPATEQKIYRRVTRVGTFEVSVPTHVALRMFIMQVLASQLHFLANRNAGLAIPPLFWPVNCIKLGGHVLLLSGPTVYSLYCAPGSSRIWSQLQVREPGAGWLFIRTKAVYFCHIMSRIAQPPL